MDQTHSQEKTHIYKRGNEIIMLGHVEEFQFHQKCESENIDVQPGTIKQIYQAMRFKGRQIVYINCGKHTRGAEPVTTGILR